jgi:hypothetical protein
MSDAVTIAIAKVEAGVPSEDGKLFAIKTTRPDGEPLSIAFAADQLMALADLAAVGHSQTRKLQHVSPTWKEFHKTTWFELSQDKATGLIILSLTFGAGGTLSFSLPEHMPEQIVETLQTMMGKVRSVPVGTRLS